MTGRRRASLVRTLVAVVALRVGPAVASAHEVAGTRFDAPIPLSLLFGGAGATVAVTAIWLGVGGREAVPSVGRRTLYAASPRVAGAARTLVAGLFLLSTVAVLAAGLLGRQVPAENFATVFGWAVWFQGVGLLAVLLGNVWPSLSPWRTMYRGLVALEGRRLAVLGEYPSWLGSWPAVAGFVALLGIGENLTVVPRSPRLTTVVVAVYVLCMVAGAVAVGPAWFRRADPLGVLYRLLGRVSAVVLHRTDDGGTTVSVRPPWRGCLDAVADRSLVVMVVAAVYTVSFDGFTDTRTFQTVLFWARGALHTGVGTSILLYLVGLAGFVAAFYLVSGASDRLGAPTDPDATVAGQFAPTVLPIAAAYEVAHNYPYVVGNVGQLVGVVIPGAAPVDPLSWLSIPLFWGSQVALIVVGHVVAVVAAHEVALDRYPSTSAARRGHLPLVVLMVGYTVLSLWIISQPVVS